MCLAVPGRVLAREGDELTVDFQGSRLVVSGLLTPEAQAGDWVLVHAGFAITCVDEAEVRQTWQYLQELAETDDDFPSTTR